MNFTSWKHNKKITNQDMLDYVYNNITSISYSVPNNTSLLTIKYITNDVDINNTVVLKIRDHTTIELISENIFKPNYAIKITQRLTYNGGTDRLYEINEYACKSEKYRCINKYNDSLGNSDLVLHTLLKAIVDGNDGSISYEGKLYYQPDMMSFWEGQSDILELLSDQNMATGDYVSIGTQNNELDIKW